MILVGKFGDHLPLNRQSAAFAREGIELEVSTLADWVGGVSRGLQPLVDALKQYVLSTEKLHGDDVPVPVLSPGSGKTKTGRLWTYVRDDRPAGSDAAAAVWFAYSPDRSPNIRPIIWPRSEAGCKRMPFPASIDFTNPVALRRSHAGRMFDVSFMTSIKRMHRRLRKKRWSGSPHCMESRKRFGAGRPMNGCTSDKLEHGHCWSPCMRG